MVKTKGFKTSHKNSSGTFHHEEESEEVVLKKWYEGISDAPDDYKILPTEEADVLRNEARVVLENDTLHKMNKRSSGTNQSHNQWLQTMMTKGTLQDRIASSVVLVQNSPLYSLSIIKNLVNLVKAGKKDCTKVMEILTDLFVSDLLLPDRKLQLFEKQPLSLLAKLSGNDLIKRKFYLTKWYFEDQLKKEYLNFVRAIISLAQDTVDSNREKSIIAMQKLLTSNPEQEVLLLSGLVNKIGDPTPKVATRASFSLTNVLKEHPSMKTVVMEEIEKLLFRPNISPRAQYYGICFLSQYLLTKDDEELATRLIQLYFSFFKGCIKKGDVDTRMMSALLVGVKRAFPYSRRDELEIKDHINTMYKIVHIAHFNISLHALCLLFQVSGSDTMVSDRFYSALYQKMLDPRLSGSSHHAIFISLVFRAMSKDLQYARVKVFVKRLLQICHYVPVTLACGILIMISHMLKKNTNLQSLILVATDFKEEDGKSDEEHYEDIKVEEEEEDAEKVPDVASLGEEPCGAVLPPYDKERDTVAPTWHHAANLKEISGRRLTKQQSMYSRNPLFASDQQSVYTELVTLCTHFHPTVALFANHLLAGKNIDYTGDPLHDFTLTRFLERWVFKNPKKIVDAETASKHSRKTPNPSGIKAISVNSLEYVNFAETNVPAEEMFMYRFMKKQQREGRGPRRQDEDDSDVSSVASDEFEGMMDKLMGGKEVLDFSEGISQLPTDDKKKKKRRTEAEGDSDGSISSEEEENNDSETDEGDTDDDDLEEVDDDGTSEMQQGEDDLSYAKIKEEFSDLDELSDDDEAITFDDGNEEDFSFTMSDVERDDENNRGRMKDKKAPFKAKKLKKGIDNSVFAPAEEFAQILENTGDQIAKYGSLANISNADKAGMKQLQWEMKRNQWIHGRNNGKRKSGRPVKKPLKRLKR